MTQDQGIAIKNPSHPGSFVRLCVLEPLELNVTQAAAKLGVTRAALSNFLNANTSLSPEMAIRLDKAFTVGGQADAGIADRQADRAWRCVDGEDDLAVGLPADCVDRFDGILDDVGQRLPELAAVTDEVGVNVGRNHAELDRRMRDFVEEQRLARDIDQRFGPE